MKKVLFAIVAMAAMSASADYVTVKVCNLGESGQECKMVTYKSLPANPATPATCTVAVGDASYGACPTHTGVPSLLAKINKYFTDRGFKPATQQEAP